MRHRVEAAIAFAAHFAAPLFLPTGGVGRHGPSEASVMASLLRQHGVPHAHILLEETGTDTWSSARAVARLLSQHAITAPVYVASSRYHQPRCVVLLRLLGLRANAAGPPYVPAIADPLARWYWRGREALALPYDVTLALLLRLRARG